MEEVSKRIHYTRKHCRSALDLISRVEKEVQDEIHHQASAWITEMNGIISALLEEADILQKLESLTMLFFEDKYDAEKRHGESIWAQRQARLYY